MSMNFRISQYLVCPSFTSMTWAGVVSAKPADSRYPSMMRKPLVTSQSAWLSLSSSASVIVQCHWGQASVSLVFSSCVKALRCVWAHYTVAVWILLNVNRTRGWSMSLSLRKRSLMTSSKDGVISLGLHYHVSDTIFPVYVKPFRV